MAACPEFSVDVTAARLDAALPAMIAGSLELQRRRMALIFWPIVISCAVVLYPLMIWFVFDERERRAFVPVSIVGAAILIGFFYWIRNWMLKARNPLADRAVRWTARLAVNRLKQSCPYRVQYRLADDRYQATIDQLNLVRERRAAQISLVCRSSGVFAFYPRGFIVRPFMIFVDDASQTAIVERFIAANEISCVALEESSSTC